VHHQYIVGEHRGLLLDRTGQQSALLRSRQHVAARHVGVGGQVVGDDSLGRHRGDRAAMAAAEGRHRDGIDRRAVSHTSVAIQSNVAGRVRRLHDVAQLLGHLPQQRSPLAIDVEPPLGVHLAVRNGAERAGEHRKD